MCPDDTMSMDLDVDEASASSTASPQLYREGDLEDDAVGEWTDTEDMHKLRRATEDEVRKFVHALSIYLITLPRTLRSFTIISPPFRILLYFVSRRA